MDNDTMTKPCSVCGVEYPRTPEFFVRNKGTTDGLHPQCKVCSRKYDKWRHDNPEEYEAEKQRNREAKQRVKELTAQGLKACSICHEVKAFEHFYKMSAGVTGYKSACKACYAESMGWEHMPRKQFPPAPEGFKYCTKCDKLLPVSGYYTGSARTDNLTSWCKECSLIDAEKWRRKYGWKPRVINEIDEDGLLRCRECKKKKPANDTYFIRHNGTRSRFSTRCKVCEKKWRQTNGFRFRSQKVVHAARRRARILGLADNFSETDWNRCLDWWDNCCAYCGEPKDLFRRLFQDHVVPVVSGGAYVPDNIIPACQTCNTSKGKRELQDWASWKFGERKAKKILARIEAYFEWVKQQDQ